MCAGTLSKATTYPQAGWPAALVSADSVGRQGGKRIADDMLPIKKRRRKSNILSGDSLKNLGMVSGLVVTLYQGWQAGRKATAADDRAGAAAAYAVNAGEQRDTLAARVRSLEARLVKLERRPRLKDKAYGPEPAPDWYEPKPSRGWLSRLLGHND